MSSLFNNNNSKTSIDLNEPPKFCSSSNKPLFNSKLFLNLDYNIQEELNDLRISPFIKQAEERGNVYRNLQISQKKLAETKKNLDEKEKKLNEAELKLGSLEKENEQLKRSLNIEKIDKEKYKEESLKLKLSRVEREKSDKLFQDKLNKYNQYGEIDSDFTNILSIYKRQNDDLNWANINFIEPDLLKNKNPNLLLKEIERLRLEKTSLGKELENAKNSLLIQQQINTEYKREKDYEQEKNKSEIKFLKNKIEESCKTIFFCLVLTFIHFNWLVFQICFCKNL